MHEQTKRMKALADAISGFQKHCTVGQSHGCVIGVQLGPKLNWNMPLKGKSAPDKYITLSSS
jgi:hypothetical protein